MKIFKLALVPLILISINSCKYRDQNIKKDGTYIKDFDNVSYSFTKHTGVNTRLKNVVEEEIMKFDTKVEEVFAEHKTQTAPNSNIIKKYLSK